jgi:hypothetical protein
MPRANLALVSRWSRASRPPVDCLHQCISQAERSPAETPGGEPPGYVCTPAEAGYGGQPRTPRQLRNRAVLRCLGGLWKGFSDPDKAYWAELIVGSQTAYNAFCSYNLRQAVQGWMPQMAVNAMHLGTPAAPTAPAATVVDNTIHVTWTDGTLAYTTGIHLGASAGFEPAMSNLVYATLATDGDDRQATIVVAPGTWYLKARSGDEDGGVGTPTTSVGPLVIVAPEE